MSDTIHLENIKKRARLENKTLAQTTQEYFDDHPEWYQEPTDVDKRAAEDRERIDATVELGTERIACRDKLDLAKAADRATAQTKLFAEDPALYKRYTAANTVRVGRISLTD